MRKSAVVQTVLRNMSVNGKLINRSYPSPYHVTQRLKKSSECTCFRVVYFHLQ